MSNDAGNGGFVPPDDKNGDPGEPVAGLTEMEIEPSAGFLLRLRDKIERRSLSTHFLALAWYVPKMVILEFVTIVFYFFGPADDRKGDKP